MKRPALLATALCLLHARIALWMAIRFRPQHVCRRRIALWRLRIGAARPGSTWGYAQ